MVLILALFTGFVYAQRKPKIKGNKNVVEVLEELPPFKAIELKDDLDILLKKSAVESYSIVADDNLIDVLKFRVVDNTLIISAFYKITSKRELVITVNYRDLETITLVDGKIIVPDPISTAMLNIDVSGTSKIELNANTDWATINMKDNSSGIINMQADSLDINLKDKADLQLYSGSVSQNIRMKENSSAQLEGTTDSLNIQLGGSANVKGQKLEAAVIRATVGETSVCRINSYRDLELSASGSARIYLFGNPKITIIDFLDSSELYKRPD